MIFRHPLIVIQANLVRGALLCVPLILAGCNKPPAKESSLPIPAGCEKYFDGYGAKREVVIVDQTYPNENARDVRLHFAEYYLDRPLPLGPMRPQRLSSEYFMLKFDDASAFDPKWRFSDEGSDYRSRTNFREQMPLSITDGATLKQTFTVLAIPTDNMVLDPDLIKNNYAKISFEDTDIAGMSLVTSKTNAGFRDKDLYAYFENGELNEYLVCTKDGLGLNRFCVQNFDFRNLSIGIRYSQSQMANHTSIRKRAEDWLKCVYADDTPASGEKNEDVYP